MRGRESLRLAARALRQHRFRSALATLGIVFGVAAVEAMISISEGARRETVAQIEVLGVDNIIARSVRPSDVETGGNPIRLPLIEYGLLRRDLEHVRQTFPAVRRAVGVRQARLDIYSPRRESALDLKVVATEPDYLRLTRSTVARGRFLSPVDETTEARVCVVGAEAAREIFSYHDPLDQLVRIGSDWYRVIGVLHNHAALRDAGGDDVNNLVFVPLQTALARHGDVSMMREGNSLERLRIELDAILLQVAAPDAVLPVARRLRAYLEKTHRDADWQLLVPLELLQQKAAAQRIFAIVMGSIASISLLVGGIGIMNIMLANVSDRRQEIGTRRAVGARRRDILAQFLIEATLLTALGGLLGVGVGFVLSEAVSRFAAWPTAVSVSGVALGLAVAGAAGLTFGIWPAHRAASVDPIEALRDE